MTKVLVCLLIAGLAACQEAPEEVKKATDAQDAGREFIRALLDGKYETAHSYMLIDATNERVLNSLKAGYKGMSEKEKDAYRNATIRPVSISNTNDSTTIYRYYHTGNPNDTIDLRIIHRNNEFLVDVKSAVKM